MHLIILKIIGYQIICRLFEHATNVYYLRKYNLHYSSSHLMRTLNPTQNSSKLRIYLFNKSCAANKGQSNIAQFY